MLVLYFNGIRFGMEDDLGSRQSLTNTVLQSFSQGMGFNERELVRYKYMRIDMPIGPGFSRSKLMIRKYLRRRVQDTHDFLKVWLWEPHIHEALDCITDQSDCSRTYHTGYRCRGDRIESAPTRQVDQSETYDNASRRKHIGPEMLGVCP